MSWFAGFGAAVSIKLSSSIDDVVWLTPFLTSNTSRAARVKNAAIYIGVCLLQTVVAMGIAYSGDALVAMATKNVEGAWSTDKILTVSAGVLLSVYACKLGYEYIWGEEEDEEEDVNEGKEQANPDMDEGETPKALSDGANEDGGEQDGLEEDCRLSDEEHHAPQKLHINGGRRSLAFSRDGDSREFVLSDFNATGCKESHHMPNTPNRNASRTPSSRLLRDVEAGASGSSGQDVTPSSRHQRIEAKQTQTLFVVAFLGSVDDLTLFVPMLAGKGFDIVQLVVGGFVAATAIVLLCIFVGLCKPVADCLSRVPLVAIVVAFATTLLVKAVRME